MSTIAKPLALICVMSTLYVGTSLGADTGSDVSDAKDLTAVIALQGLPCGQVVKADQQGENDYIATCQDGNRYRVSANADGRVSVTKLNK